MKSLTEAKAAAEKALIRVRQSRLAFPPTQVLHTLASQAVDAQAEYTIALATALRDDDPPVLHDAHLHGDS